VSDSTPTYSFLPWLRSGIANAITQQDRDATVKVRASFPLDVTLSGAKPGGGTVTHDVHRDVSLFGPGDIVGIDAKAIVKVEPRHWLTNFEPNLLPYVEFYDEDFPWRYVPAAADTAKHRLRPWLALVVLTEEEFEDGVDIQKRPLPSFKLKAGVKTEDVFARPLELWAWAHVHVNQDLSANGDGSMPGVLSRLKSALDANPDRACARILCPRRLEPNKGYHAFLIPTFETGRLAGLGQAIPPGTVATASAWDSGQAEFPIYHRWYFKTGRLGDFEYLVRLLKPRPADKRVGVRDMDVLHPGSALPPIDLPAELGGVLKLGGALRVPLDTLPPEDQAETRKYDEWDEHPYPHPFEQAMAARVNLADDYTRQGPSEGGGDPDPVITSPLYGRWHALVSRVLKEADGTPAPQDRNWVHELNLDPRFRVSAGLGTKVVQKGQEEYMNAAWEQVGDIIAANERLRLALLAQAASAALHRKHLAPLATEKLFVLTAPVHRRVVAEGLTLHAHVFDSVVPPAVTSAPFRRVTRPGAPLLRKLGITEPREAGPRIVGRINAGELLPAPPKVAPSGVIQVKDAVEVVRPRDAPGFVLDALEHSPWLRYLPLLLLVLLALLALAAGPEGIVCGLVLGGALLYLFLRLSRWSTAAALAKSLREEEQTPASVDALPPVTGFVLTGPGSPEPPVRPGLPDNGEAIRFKAALKDVYTYTSVPFPRPVKKRLNLPGLATTTLEALDPIKVFPKRVGASLSVPAWLRELQVETFAPVMAYPVLDVPMYRPLSELSSELFLPNINLIPPDSLTLLESNQKFIEAYMVGVNHEMSRELLWREYPTDQRGSPFRQFWDVSGALPETPTLPQRDALRDIPPLHLWSRASPLGAHNQREAQGDAAQLVLVIRGELLKRYPTAVIYAQKARWHRREDGTVDTSAERELVPLTTTEEDDPPKAKVLKPLFEAKVEPDIYFLGFDLTGAQAKGGPGPSDDEAGWFFVIKERPGEPRFGMDEAVGGAPPRLINWNNLTWEHVGTTAGRCIALDQTLPFQAYSEPVDQENKPNPEDAQAKWTPGTNSAELAYILYQVPVLVAVHAHRMLP
jgi:hypothetical protein